MTLGAAHVTDNQVSVLHYSLVFTAVSHPFHVRFTCRPYRGYRGYQRAYLIELDAPTLYCKLISTSTSAFLPTDFQANVYSVGAALHSNYRPLTVKYTFRGSVFSQRLTGSVRRAKHISRIGNVRRTTRAAW